VRKELDSRLIEVSQEGARAQNGGDSAILPKGLERGEDHGVEELIWVGGREKGELKII